MVRDLRGGYNRKFVNEKFFKSWSPKMAYVLGFLFADGSILNTEKSSRTFYVQFSNNDEDLIKQIKQTLSSKHNISRKETRLVKFKEKHYLCKATYSLRIGNKILCHDLKNLGLTHRKSLNMLFPKIPDKYFNFFLRGYFDGDGSITAYIPRNQKAPRLQVIFTSGSNKFLESLSAKLHKILETPIKKLNSGNGAFQIRYRKTDSLKILSFMYENLYEVPYLKKKYQVYLETK